MFGDAPWSPCVLFVSVLVGVVWMRRAFGLFLFFIRTSDKGGRESYLVLEDV